MSKKETGKMTMAEMLKEYNTLTGNGIKKFSSRAVAEHRLAGARITVPKAGSKSKTVTKNAKVLVKATTKKPNAATGVKKPRIKVQVGSRKFPSVHNAYMELNIPLGTVHRTRKELHATGKAIVGKHNFKVIK